MTHTPRRRKGSRSLDIGQGRWTYYVGKKFVEVRDPVGAKTLIPREKLDVLLRVYHCDVCDDSDCRDNQGERPATLPGAVARYIRANLRT